MIAEFLNRGVVLDQLAQIIESIEFDVQRDGTAAPAGETDLLRELRAAAARESAASSGPQGFEPQDTRRSDDVPPLDDYAFISHDQVISLVQSALDEVHDRPEHADKVVDEPPGDDRRGDSGEPVVTDRTLVDAPEPVQVGDRRLFDRFSVTDVQWVRSKIAEGIRQFRHKKPFVTQPAPPVAVAERFRLVLVGDWGSGIPRAQKVGTLMRQHVDAGRAAGLPVHVLHLGDVYYSGWGHEYRSRFLPYWPVQAAEADAIGSWCLNGNHDMYSGGHAYYEVALGDPRFQRWQQGSSFFSIVNKHWKLLGLDTAWEDHAIVAPQPDWLTDELKRAGGRRTLLFSHHQLFSAYEGVAAEVAAVAAPILALYPATGWFWGHEHRCVVYGAHANVGYSCCLGNGGVPVYMNHNETDAYVAPATYEYRKFIQKGIERWALFGFAVLDFDGPSLTVRYYDEEGRTHRTDTVG